MLNLNYFINNFIEWFNIFWQNIYFRWLFFYIIYFLIIFIVLKPIWRYFIKPLIKKTKTDVDDKLFNQNRRYLNIIILLLWLIFVYELYFKVLLSDIYIVVYKIILTIIYVILYVILHKTVKILLNFCSVRFSEIIDENIVNLSKIVLSILIFSIISLLILTVWGFNITPILWWAGIFWFAIAMWSKNIIENFLSWMLIFFDKTINIWDFVILSDETMWNIQEINIRTILLKTFDWAIVILPNSDFLNQKLTNKSLWNIIKQKRLDLTISISYWDDTKKAKELLGNYLSEIEWADSESVTVYLSSLSDWSVDITWKVMIDSSKRNYLAWFDVKEKVYKEFPKHWLHFPFPTYSIEQKKD